MNIKRIAVSLLCLTFFHFGFSQTQEEIQQLLNGGSTTTEEVKEEKASKEKKAKEKEEKVKEEKTKAEKEVKAKKEKAEKEVKEEKTKAVKEKEEKSKSAKETKEKAEKTAKVKEEKVKEEKPVKVKESTSTSSSSASSSRFDKDKPFRTWSFGITGGLSNPVTDIRYKDWFGTIDPINENQWNAGIRVTKMFDAAFGIQWKANYSVVQGAYDSLVVHKEDKEYLQAAGIDRGIYFKNNVISTSFNIYWNISNTVFGTNKYLKAKANNKTIRPRKFSLYMYTGVGGTWFDPHVMFIDNKAPASFTGIDFKDSQSFEIHIPMALGAKFNLGKSTDLGIEYVVNYVFTDKLDGFNYNHPGRIKNDLFTNLNVTLDFKLGSKKTAKEHIEWVHPSNLVFDELAKIDEMDKKLKKLTKDEDEDGVSDFFDKDLETKEGDIVDGSGRALDSDGDGIPDKADLEPFSDKDAEVDEFGISLDDDNDGVPNHLDLEKDTEEGSFVNFQGIAFDGEVSDGESRGISFPSIFFDTDKADIKREYEDELFMIAKDMLRLEDTKFLLTGHCDERGSEEYNQELGTRRAEAVKNYLVENYNIDPNRIEVLSKGKTEINSPRFHINRRVDVLLIEK